jgi:hypothetical protein
MTIGSSICPDCTHLDRDTSIEVDGILTGVCAAFPAGIPDEIFAGGFDHRIAFRGDGGTRFEPMPDVTDADVDATLSVRL